MYFQLSMRNPFSKQRWTSPWDTEVPFTKNKSIEMQINHDHDLFSIGWDIRFRGQDHAGPRFNIGLFGWEFMIGIYDHRHWNYEKWRWEVYPGEDDHGTSSTGKVKVRTEAWLLQNERTDA